jgi:hypothetical protein
MKHLILLTLLLSTQAQADKLILGGFSHHFQNRELGYNEIHPAIGIERNGLELALTVNSFDRPSLMLAKIDKPFSFKGFDFGYRVGLGTGYEDKYLGVIPDPKGEDCQYNDEYRCKNERDDIYQNPIAINGIQPIAQFVISKEYKLITVDLGLSTVSTVIFKINI